MNSFFATSIIAKNENQITRVLKKRQLDNRHYLIMPVNYQNHWYFAVFQEGEIVVFDSMAKSPAQYLQMDIFKNALKFSKFFYGGEYRLVVRPDYPQQNNYSDCGVFMLMGIRDTLRDLQWSYHQGDMKFKRIQIAHEVLKEKLMYNG